MAKDKVRTSGLYLPRATYEAIQRLRERGRPVLTLNRVVLNLLHEALARKRCSKKGKS